ncbi:alpha-N-arabinofuranosidase [Brachybacterium phenoliresistens]|uniref:non-reducing end alpha-L-arabinofuranosidase n=1 Tax=Brachybacterium phenoliresistens TaxID=396014 RepID=Z9JVD0_9MICO|nr:alpha-L-arabinofuranosidase C-terminal domain-containing protein [Brachybacterium phenoliresistens]EWS82335.1 alpha-N-arabinofuranosidase [Brachybacterium phenoliresistens]
MAPASSTASALLTAQIDLAPAPADDRIDPMIYGHFLESAFFHNIEGGVFDEGSPLSVTGDGPLAGCRQDVIDACRALGMPVVRWPGGNFTSAYWWEDGTGPRDERPRRLELAWGSEESNRFGTPEFLAWCEATGATPYLAHSCRSVEDAVRWVEYCNYEGDTAMTRRRAADGIDPARPVPIWGIGNEVYGPWQMGHRSPERYAADALEHARFMRAVDPSIEFVAVGLDEDRWTDAVVRELGETARWFSVHAYGAGFHLVDPSREEFDAIVSQALHFEQVLQGFSRKTAAAAARHGITRPLEIALDEWNMRHYEPRTWEDPQPGADGGIAPRDTSGPADAPGTAGENGWRVSRYSPRTLADALFYAGVFHAIHRTAGNDVPVTMANTVNLVNANGLLAVREEGLVRSATYHVWDLYLNHFGTRALPVRLAGPSVTLPVRHEQGWGGEAQCRQALAAVPLLDVSASASADGTRRFVAIINRSADQDVRTALVVDGAPVSGPVTVRTLGADAPELFAANTLDAPDVLGVRESSTTLEGGEVTVPAHSITVLSWQAPAG